VFLDKKSLNFVLGGKTSPAKKPVVETGLFVIQGIETAEALAVVVEFVVDVVGGVFSA
jgi:hypothetical protein